MLLYVISLLCILIGVIIDQYTKQLAVTHLQDASVPIIENVFELQYLENRGAAFGMLQNQQWFFLIITVVLLFFITKLYMGLPRTKRVLPLRVSMIFITTGAIGNLIDRIRFNYVIDFLYFKLIDFPIFNIADIFVTVSTFFIAFLVLFYYKEAEFDEFTKCLSWKRRKQQE